MTLAVMANLPRYRVTAFADLTGVTVKALRHYDRLGLLRPARTNAGHRLYAMTDLARIRQIVALRFLGIPLKQIRLAVGNEAVRGFALRH